MDAKTIYSLLKPHLDSMKPTEKKSLSNLIIGIKERKFSRTKRRISLSKAKEKLKKFRRREMMDA